jgi:hypothetical protein
MRENQIAQELLTRLYTGMILTCRFEEKIERPSNKEYDILLLPGTLRREHGL